MSQINFKKIERLIISPNASIKAAMKNLSLNKEKILFVINSEYKLIGSLTDGDIRRALLKGIGFECPIGEIMHKNPHFVRSTDKKFREIAKRYVQNEKYQAIPILDSDGKIEDVLFWYDFFKDHPIESNLNKYLSTPVVIMAGGQGQRLDPFTKILPKPLIPIGNQPIIEKIMNSFYKSGFKNFTLTLNYKKELIKMYFKENQQPYHVEWVEEKEYLGTAGSLALLRDCLNEAFFVSNCDIILDADFRKILEWHKSEKALLSLVGCHKEVIIPYGSIVMNEGHLKSLHEKPKFDLMINTGIYVMEPAVLELISDDEKIDMNHLIERVSKKGKITVYPLYDGWFDLGQWSEYRESLALLQKNISFSRISPQ